MSGFPIIKQRNINDTINASYFYPHLHQDIMFMVSTQEPTELRMLMQAKSLQVANADDYRIDMMWEVLTPDEHSNQVAVRISSRLEWKEEVNFASKALIERNYKGNVQGMLEFYGKWAPTKIEEYERTKEYVAEDEPIIDEVDLGPTSPPKTEPATPLDDGYDDQGAKNATATNSTQGWESESNVDAGWDDPIPWSSQEKTPIRKPEDNVKPKENLDDWDKEMNGFRIIKPSNALFLM